MDSDGDIWQATGTSSLTFAVHANGNPDVAPNDTHDAFLTAQTWGPLREVYPVAWISVG
jgi:hypothetical protein